MVSEQSQRLQPPEDLDGEALLEWQRVCAELASQGRLNQADRALLTIYARTWATWRDASRHVDAHGSIIQFTNGTRGPNPFYKVMTETGKQLRGLLQDMGLNPNSRRSSDAPADSGDLDI
jgi:P27 family predicted phage terminase small subunit